ncbi:TPA: YtxH domain-containing protein [Streptococcus pyogenes]
MNKSFKNLVIGAVSGVAAAYFLSTEKGSEYSHLARDTFYDVKDKLASGDLTKEDMLDLLKDKTTAFVQKTKETLAEVEAKEKQDDVIIDLNEEDIIIDYTEQDEPVSDTLDKH